MATSPRQIVPTLSPLEHASMNVLAPGAHLTYHNGPVISAVEVVAIFWGAAWAQPAQSALIAWLNQFFDFILTSPYIDLLAEYSVAGHAIGHGHRISTVTMSSSEPGAGGVVSDAQIQQALQAWIANGSVPPTTANTLYFVYLPPGVSSTLGPDQSCQVFCGYHSHINGAIYYAVEPYITCLGCSFGQIRDSLTKVSSHELCEAITDPALSAWWDDSTGNEIGDICNGTALQFGGFTIQSEWSNQANNCLSQPAGQPGPTWGGWESLGGSLFTPVSAVARAANRLDIFANGIDFATYHKWWDGAHWGGWESLGGIMTSPPHAVSWGPNRLDLFATGTDHAVWHKSWDGTHWGGWESLGGILISPPHAVTWGPNRLDVFATGTDQAAYYKAWDGTHWGNWESLGGVLTSPPHAVSWGPNRLDIFGNGTDHAAYHKGWDGAQWGAWESLGGVLTSPPRALAWGPNRLDVFGIGTDNAVWHKEWDVGQWGAWESLGSSMFSLVSAVSWGANRRDIFAIGTDNAVYHNAYDGTHWGGWESLGGSMFTPVGAAAWGPARLDVFAIGVDSGVWHKWYG